MVRPHRGPNRVLSGINSKPLEIPGVNQDFWATPIEADDSVVKIRGTVLEILSRILISFYPIERFKNAIQLGFAGISILHSE